MSSEPQPARVSVFPNDRRRSVRRGVKSLAYIDLGNGTGGIVLNMSEGGVAIHSAVTLTSRELPSIRFQLPNSPEWVAAGGDIAWLDAKRKEAGVRFATMPAPVRAHIREWIASASEDSAAGAPTIGGMQLTSLKLGRIPGVGEARPPREGQSQHEIERHREIEPIDRKLRLHFATRDSASARSARSDQGLWWAFILGVGILATLSFVFGWVAGHGQGNDVSAVLARISGRIVAHAQNASNIPTVAPPVSSADLASQSAPPVTAAPSGPPLPSVTFTTRAYVSVSEEASNDAPGAPHSASAKAVELQIGKLAHRVDPVYPEEALSQHVEGTVQLRATIGPEGQVDSVSVISGDPTLASAAEDAVRQWHYAPTLLDGKPVPAEQAITVVFSLPETN